MTPQQPSNVLPALDPRPRCALTCAYDGTDFHGWQKQNPPDGSDVRTVAGVIEQAMIKLLRQPINLVGASRTDAGVHAKGQVAHFNADVTIALDRLPHAVTSRLPDDAQVTAVRSVDADFDAIRSATSKQYRYRIHSSTKRPLFDRHYVWHCHWTLDAARMADAAARIVGEHDFGGFAAAGHGRTSTVRRVFDCNVQTYDPEVHIVISANGFLYNMVRIIVGTLVEVGRGRRDPDVIDHIFTTTDRQDAGGTVQPSGLCLEWVKYDAPE